ncbi:pyridoxal phosphate phosphatase PHOSPHO2 isoform 2-T3 [Aulostomus maculatus]
MKTLMVFDFDHTVVDDNSDTWVIRCLPGQTLPDNVKNSYRKGHWTEFMGRVMNYIGDQEVSPDRVRSVMETIPFTAGMADLLTFISEQKNAIDCIIISDANTMFIDWILHAAGLQAAVDRVFTNPAKFNDLGYMEAEVVDVSSASADCIYSSRLTVTLMDVETLLKTPDPLQWRGSVWPFECVCPTHTPAVLASSQLHVCLAPERTCGLPAGRSEALLVVWM